MKTSYVGLIPFFVFAFIGIVFVRGLSLKPQELPSAQLGKTLPNFSLPLLGQDKEFFRTKDLYGQVSLLNVWASWCSSCEQEQLFLLSLVEQGWPIFAIDYKDKTNKAMNWLKIWGNPYRLIGEDKEGRVGMDLGVYGVPETYLLDANGIIVYRHAGVLDELAWKKEFIPRLRELGVLR